MRSSSQGSTLPPLDWCEPLPEVACERELMPFEIERVRRAAEQEQLAAAVAEMVEAE